jgi:peptidoglycan/xylan/chitin deacetylase (PgdA/CDA1 family)
MIKVLPACGHANSMLRLDKDIRKIARSPEVGVDSAQSARPAGGTIVNTIRDSAKGLAEALLVGSGTARLVRCTRAGKVLVLAYHNVVPDEDAAALPHPLHLSISRFRRQLDFLEAETEVIPLDHVGERRTPGSRPKVVITFDDAYVGAVEIAAAELARRGLSATVFVCPGMLEAPGFWWDVFEPPADDRMTYWDLAGDHERVTAWLMRQGSPRTSPSRWRRPAGADQIHGMLVLGSGSIRVGGHTWTHPNLAALEDGRLRQQLQSTWDWLQERDQYASAWLACPYGYNSPRVAGHAADIGYRGVLEVDGGWIPARKWDRWSTPRLSIPAGISELGFELRISGLVRR